MCKSEYLICCSQKYKLSRILCWTVLNLHRDIHTRLYLEREKSPTLGLLAEGFCCRRVVAVAVAVVSCRCRCCIKLRAKWTLCNPQLWHGLAMWFGCWRRRCWIYTNKTRHFNESNPSAGGEYQNGLRKKMCVLLWHQFHIDRLSTIFPFLRFFPFFSVYFLYLLLLNRI